VTCTRAAALVAGATAPAITLVVHVDPDRVAAVTNTGVVGGPSPDPVPGNNTATVVTTPAQSADLAIEKSSPGDFIPGTQGTYRFQVHNFGPSYADPPVRITDTLPGYLTYVSFDSVTPGWSCSAAAQVVTCDRAGRFANGADATVDIVVAIDPNHVGPIVNTARVGSPTPDPNLPNNVDGDNTSSVVNVDLAIAKSHVGPVVAGRDVAYTLAVVNNGPSAAAGPITVTDTLPEGLTLVSANGTDWTCSGAGRDLTCTRQAGLGALSTAPPITLVAHVAPEAGPATLINFANVAGVDTDIDLDNNTALDPTEVDDLANISLTKTTTGPDPVQAGRETAFTIVVHNDGPSVADDVRVSDALPPGTSLVSAEGTGWTCAGDVSVICSRSTIAAGANAPPIVLRVLVASGVPEGTIITNRATSTTSTPGDDPVDNSDDATVEVRTAADLAIDKSHPAGQVSAGDQVTFSMAVSNLGPSDALAPVTVTDQLPAGMTYLSVGNDWTCAPGAPATSGQQVACTLNGDDGVLAGTEAPVLRLTVQVDAALDPGTRTNRAVVKSPTPDLEPGNNADTDDVGIDTRADLSIVKTHTASPRVGDPLSFSLVVANAGPSQARQVRVSDDLPVGLDYISAQGDGWTCTIAARLVTCALAGPLGPQQTAPAITLTVRVTAEAYSTVANTAVVSTTTPETKLSDNTSTDNLSVPAQVDLAITKTHQQPVRVGEEATYRIKVVNHGPTTDPGPVTVTDSLPGGLEYVEASGDGWDCAFAKGTVTCTDADGLAVGEGSVISLVVAVGPEAAPLVVNVASVTSPAEDTDLDNNTATDPADVRPQVILTVEKNVLSLTTETARYRVAVTNEGPNDTVTDIVVVDHLPAGLTYVNATGPGWDCQAVVDVVTCVHPGKLRVGDTSAFDLTASVDGATGRIVNRVAVTAGHTGPDPTDSAPGRIPSPGEPPGPGGGGDPLPPTGGPSAGWLWAGLALLVGGLGLLTWSRRRP
jgi:uncharacterized repeat protein (TIGR01451 family)